jgi:hypothetical protein
MIPKIPADVESSPPAPTYILKAAFAQALWCERRIAEAKEFLAGYWIVDVESPKRAYEIAARASAAPGPGGVPLNLPIEMREVMSAPPVEV